MDLFFDESTVTESIDTFFIKPDKKACGIKYPNYLSSKSTGQRIARLLPDTKLIAILRDPVERAASAWFQYLAFGLVPFGPVQEGLTALLENRIDQILYPHAQEILTFGLYGEQISYYLSLFSKDQLQVIFYDDLVQHPFEVISNTFTFLNIGGVIPPTITHKVNKSHYSLLKTRLFRLRMFYMKYAGKPSIRVRMKRAINDEELRNKIFGNSMIFSLFYTLIRHIPVSFYRFNIQLFRVAEALAVALGPKKRPRLSADLRNRLIAYYRDDSSRLESILGHPLPLSWNK